MQRERHHRNKPVDRDVCGLNPIPAPGVKRPYLFVRCAKDGLVDCAKGFSSKKGASEWIDSHGRSLDWRVGFLFRLRGATHDHEIVDIDGKSVRT